MHKYDVKSNYDHTEYIPFRKCKVADFKKGGFEVPVSKIKKYERRLCPDEEKIKEIEWGVKNSYDNNDARTSFSIIAIKCME